MKVPGEARARVRWYPGDTPHWATMALGMPIVYMEIVRVTGEDPGDDDGTGNATPFDNWLDDVGLAGDVEP